MKKQKKKGKHPRVSSCVNENLFYNQKQENNNDKKKLFNLRSIELHERFDQG